MALISTKHGLESQKAQNVAHGMGCGVKWQHPGKACYFRVFARQSSTRFSPWHSVAGFSLFLHHATPRRSRDVQWVGKVWVWLQGHEDSHKLDAILFLPFPYSGWGWIGHTVDLMKEVYNESI